MKKVLMLAVSAMLLTGAAYANCGKKCDKEKSCCKKETTAKKPVKKNAGSTAKANTATTKA